MLTPRRPRPRAKRAYHHGNLRSDLIGAAVEIIGKHGTSALTLQALANRLGVSQAAPYRHFINKEALLAAVAVDGFQALLDAVRAEMDAAGADVVARYLAIGAGYMRFALSHRAHFQVMYGARPVEFNLGAVADAGRAAFKLLVDAIVACQSAGRAAAGDPTWIAVQTWSLVHGQVVLYSHHLLPRKVGPERLLAMASQMSVFLTAAVPAWAPTTASVHG